MNLQKFKSLRVTVQNYWYPKYGMLRPLVVCILIHPKVGSMRFKSGFMKCQSSFWILISLNYDWNKLDVWIEQLFCWKRNGPSLKCCHQVWRAALCKMSANISEFVSNSEMEINSGSQGITGTKRPRPNWPKHLHHDALVPSNFTISTLQSSQKNLQCICQT